MEILTADEVAAMLKISKGQVYELAKERTKSGDVRENPIPCLRLGKSDGFARVMLRLGLKSWLYMHVLRGVEVCYLFINYREGFILRLKDRASSANSKSADCFFIS